MFTSRWKFEQARVTTAGVRGSHAPRVTSIEQCLCAGIVTSHELMVITTSALAATEV
ncbi:MAG: hypothetical protein ABIS06_04225 [Vicinamibacterales bacterium]